MPICGAAVLSPKRDSPIFSSAEVPELMTCGARSSVLLDSQRACKGACRRVPSHQMRLNFQREETKRSRSRASIFFSIFDHAPKTSLSRTPLLPVAFAIWPFGSTVSGFIAPAGRSLASVESKFRLCAVSTYKISAVRDIIFTSSPPQRRKRARPTRAESPRQRHMAASARLARTRSLCAWEPLLPPGTRPTCQPEVLRSRAGEPGAAFLTPRAANLPAICIRGVILLPST